MCVVAIDSVPVSSPRNSSATRFRLAISRSARRAVATTISPAGRERREPLALAHEDRQAELVLELADLLADAGLRREERLGGVGDVETVIDDGAQVLELLEVHGRYNLNDDFCDNYITERQDRPPVAQYFTVHPTDPAAAPDPPGGADRCATAA